MASWGLSSVDTLLEGEPGREDILLLSLLLSDPLQTLTGFGTCFLV